jgi:hypothetical protein
MNAVLVDALRQLNLKPGEMHRIAVNGHQVEIRALPSEPESQFADSLMLDLRLDVPSSPKARTITVSRGQPMLPTPMQIDESDLAPE